LDLLFLIEGIARIGDFYDYLPPLIGRIRGLFHELNLSYLARLVYFLALIDNFQNN